jgi:hypothetical protein
MLADRYDLALSTASEAARDAYVQGCDLALTFYPASAVRFVIDDQDADARGFSPAADLPPSPGVPTGPRSRT